MAAGQDRGIGGATYNLMPMKMRRSLFALALAAAVGGCYLPVRFDSEIEINRYGAYSLIFDGYMAKVELFDGLRAGRITPAEETRQVELIRTDLRRDSATKEFSYVRQGIFKLNWRKSGDLFRTKMISFVRRNENMLSIRYVKTTGQIILEGTSISADQARQLLAIGLNMEGEVRVITDAEVASHNATQVREGPKRTYVWKITSVADPSPRLVISVR